MFADPVEIKFLSAEEADLSHYLPRHFPTSVLLNHTEYFLSTE